MDGAWRASGLVFFEQLSEGLPRRLARRFTEPVRNHILSLTRLLLMAVIPCEPAHSARALGNVSERECSQAFVGCSRSDSEGKQVEEMEYWQERSGVDEYYLPRDR
jgi:hypothetical protein